MKEQLSRAIAENKPLQAYMFCGEAGTTHVLAAYTCTPLVKFPVNALEPKAKIKGTTIAELGNRNRPLDMIVYEKDGKDYLLLANSSRGVMKISTAGISDAAPLEEPVQGGGQKGLPRTKGHESAGVITERFAVMCGSP